MLFPFHDENPIERWPVVTVAIIVLNVLSLICAQQLGDYQERELRARYGFVPARIQNPQPVEVQLYSQGDLIRGIRPPGGKPLQIVLPPIPQQIALTAVTSLFLHANWMHLLGNMWFLWLFGNNIEDRLGRFLFLGFYLVGGLIATTCHWLMTGAGAAKVPVIGASGAVAVMLGAYAVTYPFARIRTLIFIVIFFTVVELPALVVLGFWLLMQMVSAAHVVNLELGGGVAWWAHIGGFAAGAFLMPLLAAGTPEPGHNWTRETQDQFEAQPPRRDGV